MLKTEHIEIVDGDNTLKFEVRRMPATQLEEWITRAVFCLAKSGLDMPEGMGLEALGTMLRENGPAFLAKALAGIVYEDAKALLDEMLACCWRTDGGILQQVTPETADGYISDFRTLLKLRMAALKANLGFLADMGIEEASTIPAGPSIPAPRKRQGA